MTAERPITPEAETRLSTPGPAMPATPRRRRRPAVLAALALLLAGGALGASWWWQVGRFQESTDNAYVAGDIAPLSARIEGDVAAILVGDNEAVSAGQPLIRMEDQDWRARRDSAAAALAEAEASIAALGAQVAQQRAAIAAAEAAVPQADAERQRATLDAARYDTLATAGYGARQAAEKTLADRRKAEAAVAAAEANLAAARAALPVLEAQAQAATARRDTARANLSLAENNLSYTVIRAPFDGIAGNRAAQVGQHVRPGQGLIAVAPPPARQWVVANFKETQLARMQPGQSVTITLDVTRQAVHGRVQTLAPATGSLFSLLPPENATGNFTRIVQRVPVRIALDDPAAAAALRPGLSAVASVDTRDDPAAPRGLFPAAAATLRDALP